MPLKKRRVELQTVNEQLLVIGVGGLPAQVQCDDCAAWDGTPKADEAAAGVRMREPFRRLESGASHPADDLKGSARISDGPPPSGIGQHGGGATDARLRVLRDAARSLSKAVRAIRTLEASSSAALPDVGRGVDFYDEVRRFEILLIERALWHSGGSQVRAASLLGLKTTTLNSKIKGYQINLKDLA